MAVRAEGDYQRALAALLPPGPAWSTEQAAQIHALLAALAPEFARLDARAGDLLTEADPSTVTELVPDWERVMLLPDPCLGAAPSLEARQGAVRERFIAIGGPSRAYFIGLAKRLGFDVTITENRPLRAGIGRCGERLCSRELSYVWHVHQVVSVGPPVGLPDMDAVRDARASMECVINRYKPAHTEVRFHYTDFMMTEGQTAYFVTEGGVPIVAEDSWI